jgi:sulfofructose kinase
MGRAAGRCSAPRATLEPLGVDDLDLACLDGAKLLVIDGYHVDVQVRAAERAREQGTVVVLDAGHITEGMGELMALSDVLIASERYASEVAPRGELEDSLIEISRLGPETVVVKLGAEGSIGLQGDKLVRQPPLRVDVLDTTGAGDVFLGGYCFGLLRDEPLERLHSAG